LLHSLLKSGELPDAYFGFEFSMKLGLDPDKITWIMPKHA
jgi:hypothetical protein